MPFQPGHPGYKKKGTKNKGTLEKEQLRQLLHDRVAERWGEIVDELIKKEKKYVTDQIIGKAKETVALEGVEFLFGQKKDEKAD